MLIIFLSGTLKTCFTNQTLCTVARLKETANPDNQIIARGCGPQSSYTKGLYTLKLNHNTFHTQA